MTLLDLDGIGTSTDVRPGLPPALESRPSLSDAQVVLLAFLVWSGASLARPVPLWIGLLALTIGALWRRPWMVLLAGLLLSCTYGGRAEAGIGHLMGRSTYTGTVTLLSDPVDGPGMTRADVRVGPKRVELRATGSGRGTLTTLLAGERVTVSGRLGPPPPHAPWLLARHVVGVLSVDQVEVAGRGAATARAANVLRRTLERGASSMTPEHRALFTGFVLGDDRRQPATLTDDFRGSGLTHLLAVSGENVAFVLTLVGPLLRRLRLGYRWTLTIAVIGFFAMVTRFEPSVVRAGVMAGLAATAFVLGRPAPGIRLLGLAITVLVLVDPLLTRSIGFQLSVAASAGILLVAPVLRRVLPGPSALVEPLAVTAGAQLAVAPLLITTFGGLPVASLPANLLAGPAAGLVMTWGLGAGIPAGLIGGPTAAVLHLPTSVGIGWIAGVARSAASAPLGELRTVHLAVLVVALLVHTVVRRRSTALRRAARLVAGGLVVCTLLAPALGLRAPPVGDQVVGGGHLWRAGGASVLVLDSSVRLGDLLQDLRRAGLRRLDLVVISRVSASAPSMVAGVAHRWPPAAVWAPDPAIFPPGTRSPSEPVRISIGDLIVEAERSGTGGGLAVEVRVAGIAQPRHHPDRPPA